MEARSKKMSDRIGVLACYLLALLCLAGGGHRTRQLSSLVSDGRTAAAVVDGIHRGVKGLKSAELRFTVEDGTEVRTRDILPMMVFRFQKGETVTVLYDPADPKLVTVDLGIWIWLQPAVFYAGAVLLVVLGLVMPRMNRRRDGGDHG